MAKPTERDDAEHEAGYIVGYKAAWRRLLGEAIGELGLRGADKDLAGLHVERTDAVAQLRMLCREHGDNDWDDDDHLGDVIDKHLGRYLSEREQNLSALLVALPQCEHNEHGPARCIKPATLEGHNEDERVFACDEHKGHVGLFGNMDWKRVAWADAAEACRPAGSGDDAEEK
jgi:hypothetical protein